jgi:hypothetical protein
MCAAVFNLIPIQSKNPTVSRNGRRNGGCTIGGRDRSSEMFEPILDPLHRTASGPGRRGNQHNVRKHTLLDAEAAT